MCTLRGPAASILAGSSLCPESFTYTASGGETGTILVQLLKR